MIDLSGPVFLGAAVLESGRGGIARVARNMAHALLDHGASLSMMSLLDERPIEINGQSSTTVRSSKLRFLARCHCAALSHQTFFYDFIGTARAHPSVPYLRKPYVVWMHGIEIWGELPPRRKRILSGADLVLVNSNYTLQRFLQRHGPLDNARVCWLSTEEDDASPRPLAFEGSPTVLIVARMDRGDFYKGHRELIECWPRVIAAVPDARLVIVGGGSAQADVQALAQASPAAGSIELKGFLAEDGLEAMWREAHVFAMPSRGEGFGLTYIEAMRHGLPVIASVHDAGQEINLHGETGYNVNLDDPDALPDRLVTLLRSPDLLREMGQAGLARWRSLFRYDHFKQRLLAELAA